MKYLMFTVFVLGLAVGVEVNGQGELSNNAGSKSCGPYKIGIITPSKDIDFKIRISVPSKNLDQAMVFNPCPEQNRVASAVHLIVPRKQTKEFFKLPPFTLKNSEQ